MNSTGKLKRHSANLNKPEEVISLQEVCAEGAEESSWLRHGRHPFRDGRAETPAGASQAWVRIHWCVTESRHRRFLNDFFRAQSDP